MSEEEKGNQQTDNTEKQQPDEKGNQQTGKNLQSKKGCWHRIKKTAKWTALSLLILIILIPILVYLPPIQRFAVDKASKWLSEETGMDVTVGKFSLGFPLDLNMGDVLAVQDGDTMVYAENLDVSLQLMPLLKSKVVVDNVQLDNAVLHTNDLIEALRLDGRVGSLSVKADNIDLKNEYGQINQLKLRNTDLTISLADSVPPDTTESKPTKWKFDLDDVRTENVKLTIQLPPAADSTRVVANLGDGHIKGTLDLGNSLLSFPEIKLKDSSVNYRAGKSIDVGADFQQLQVAASLNLDKGDYKLSALKFDKPDIAIGIGSELSLGVQSEALRLNGDLDLASNQFNFTDIAFDEAKIRLDQHPDMTLAVDASRLSLDGKLDLNTSDYHLTGIELENPDIKLNDGNSMNLGIQMQKAQLDGHLNLETSEYNLNDVVLQQPEIALHDGSGMNLDMKMEKAKLDGKLNMGSTDYQFKNVELEQPVIAMKDGSDMNLDIEIQKAQLDGNLNLNNADYQFNSVELKQPKIALKQGKDLAVNVDMDKANLDAQLDLGNSRYLLKDVSLNQSSVALKQGRDIDLNVAVNKAYLNGDMDMAGAVYDFKDIVLQQPSVNLKQGDGMKMNVESQKMSLDANFSLGQSTYAFNDVRMAESKVNLQTGDGMSVNTNIGKGVLNGKIDLDNEQFTFQNIALANADVSYNANSSSPAAGLDPAHIAMKGMSADIKAMEYKGDGSMKMDIAHLSGKERSGLTLKDSYGSFAMNDKGMNFDNFHVSTPHSTINMDLAMDNDAFEAPSRGKKPGQFNIKMDGTIGKEDLSMALSNVRPDIVKSLPAKNLRTKIDAHGNMENLQVDRFEAFMDGVMDVKGNLKASGLTGNNPAINTQFTAKIPDTRFISKLMPDDIKLPASIDLTADTRFDNNGIYAKAHGRLGNSKVDIDGKIGMHNEDYDFVADVSNFRLQDYLPHGDKIEMTGYIAAKGHGFDPYAPTTTTNATLDIDHLRYEDLELERINGTIALFRGDFDANLSIRDPKLQTIFTANGRLLREGVDAELDIDLAHADMHELGVYDGEMQLSTKGKFSLQSDLNRQFKATAMIDTLHLRLDDEQLDTDHSDIYAETNEDTTLITIRSGDMSVDMESPENLFTLIDKYKRTGELATRFAKSRDLDISRLKRHFPEARLKANIGGDNPLIRILQLEGITFNSLIANLSTDSIIGVQGTAHLEGFQKDSLKLDEANLKIEQDSTAIRFDASAILPDHPDFKGFRAVADGYLKTDELEAELKHFDKAGDMGLDLGFHVNFADSGTTGHFLPKEPTLGYIKFKMNEDNYIHLDTLNNLFANVWMQSLEDSCQISLNATNDSSRQDVHAKIKDLDLSKIVPLAPGFIPPMEGLVDINADYFSEWGRYSVSGTSAFSNFVFDGTKVGNVGAEFTYTPEGDSIHIIKATINNGDSLALAVDGQYNSSGEGHIDADINFLDFPLTMTAPFISDQILVFDGNLGGGLHVSGGGDNYIINGQLLPNKVVANSDIYSLKLKFEDKPIPVSNSRISFNDYKIFGSGENPLTLSGWFDLSSLSNPEMSLSLYGQNFNLMNSPRTKRSLVFGRMDGDFIARVNGTANDISIRGLVKLLPTTDMTYIMANTPLSVDYRLSDIVTFVDFSRPPDEEAIRQRPVYTNTEMLINLIADNGAKFHCEFSADRQSYVDVTGEGSFNLSYTPAGTLSLIGRYTIDQGKMKYTLPAIPLKTFDIVKGSYIEFTGIPSNPMLNFAANEQTTATVSEEGAGSRSVKFKTGLEVKGSLDDMELLFTIDAPEDLNVKNELANMSPEDRNKLAVAMLCTGMYLSGSNSSGFDSNNALNSFLENEINNIANKALSTTTVNVDMGLEQTTRDDGSTRTNYSFKFSRRFFNDRLNVIIGGKVSSDDSEYENESGAYIDDVSLEWRLNESGTSYVRLFHEKNYENLFEGELISNGVSYIFRKKYGKLSEIWKPIKLKKPSEMKNVK